MMRPVKSLLFIILFLISCASLVFGQNRDSDDYLQRGLKLEKQKQYKKALDVWEKGHSELEKPDLEIGIEYTRLATEQKMDKRYQTASKIYRWGLSAKEVEHNAPALKREIEMLKPLAGNATYNKWKELLEDENPKIYDQIRYFWNKLDPTPFSPYNERFIEHWERIAYARKNFTINSASPYGTDERANSYIRYGKPDRKYSGKLELSSAKAASVVQILDPKLDRIQKQALKNAAVMVHNYPRYVIWIYEDILKAKDRSLFHIFGDLPSGGFQRMEKISDFIPSRAFTFSSRYKHSRLMNTSNDRKDPKINPGMILQYVYYEQLAPIDGAFSSVYSYIATRWEGDTRFGQNQQLNISEGPTTMLHAQNVALRNKQSAPVETSTYEQRLPSIPVSSYQYRLLNKNNNPVFLTYLESNPQHILVNDLGANQDSMFSSKYISPKKAFQYYELYHGLQVQNTEGKVISQSRVAANIILDSTNTEMSSSVFTVPELPEESMPLLYAELHNTHPASRPQFTSPFPNSLRGKGELLLSQREPLATDTTKLQMGDLILGYQMQREKGGGYIPFVVANDKRIPEFENLAVHVEVYHLLTGSDNVSRFQLSYEILPVGSRRWTEQRSRDFKLTLNMESSKSRFSENLELQASELHPGTYKLWMTATEQESGRQISREVIFEIVKRSKE